MKEISKDKRCCGNCAYRQSNLKEDTMETVYTCLFMPGNPIDLLKSCSRFSQFKPYPEEWDFESLERNVIEDIKNAPLEQILNSKPRNVAGYKNDEKDDKLRWDLLPLDLVEWVVKVYTFGVKKYGKPNSWQLIGKMSDGTSEFDRYEAAYMRHLVAHKKGEFLDPESHLPHLAHCLWNSISMLFFGLKEHENEK